MIGQTNKHTDKQKLQLYIYRYDINSLFFSGINSCTKKGLWSLISGKKLKTVINFIFSNKDIHFFMIKRGGEVFLDIKIPEITDWLHLLFNQINFQLSFGKIQVFPRISRIYLSSLVSRLASLVNPATLQAISYTFNSFHPIH